MNSLAILLFLLLGLFGIGNSLYEDQVGKFDWREQFIGRAKVVHFERGGSKRNIFVATEANVVAALNTRSGHLTWRQIFQRGPPGYIDTLLYNNEDLISVSGGGHFLRSWEPSSGFLRWEVQTTTEMANFKVSEGDASAVFVNNDETPSVVVLAGSNLYVHSLKDGQQVWDQQLPTTTKYKWLYSDGISVYTLGLVPNSHFNLLKYSAVNGALQNKASLQAAWASLQDTSCILVSRLQFVCMDTLTNSLQVASLENINVFSTTPLKTIGLDKHGPNPTLIQLYVPSTERPEFALQLTEDHHALLKMSAGQVTLVKDLPSVWQITGSTQEGSAIVTTASWLSSTKEITFRCYKDGVELSAMKDTVTLAGDHGNPTKMSVLLIEKKSANPGYRVLLETADHALTLINQPGRIAWQREEGLASVAAIEMVELPVSDTEAKFEEEFGGKAQESIGSMFLRRLSTQFAQFQVYLAHLKRRFSHAFLQDPISIQETLKGRSALHKEGGSSDENESLTRDEFSLRKIIIVVSRSGKIFGLDSEDGSLVWTTYLSILQSSDIPGHNQVLLFVRRTTAHFPHPPQCTVTGIHKVSGNTFMYSFNPITGDSFDPVNSDHILPYRAQQASMLALADEEELKILVLLDTDNKVHVYPKQAAGILQDRASSIYIFTGNRSENSLQGYRLASTGQGSRSLSANVIWNVQLPTTDKGIVKLEAKRHTEHVHSQGRVLGDRSVLYKYLNPNLVAVATEGQDASGKGHLSIYLLDVVTGHIVFSIDHKRASSPLFLVHTENWIVYHYWNLRHRRHEMTVLELYEGKVQKNSTVFSSVDPPSAPLVLRQSYIQPSALQSMAVTRTEKGITSSNILLALQSGGILALPKRFLDPRRPLQPTSEEKEEGLIPYLPELPIQHQSIINYNQSVLGIEGLLTSPAGLESTCLLLAYGLDYYFTRVTPSNLFDVLKEDFDYTLITAVLVGLVFAAGVTRKLAANKALNHAWR
ncbi:ER membrane protein complex subunit 1-like [Acanthaster planci]|uniref:ER membrane protein complex subunit 1 n=1 Tax=Acanthaster planci TaxID=133434 RepID=A0A8B7ZBL8_ACAPL|nr:ER membrane protein complex subunit 1-like [Acanthaster planci]